MAVERKKYPGHSGKVRLGRIINGKKHKLSKMTDEGETGKNTDG